MHLAAQGQHADVAVRLIEAGADLHARNRFGPAFVCLGLVGTDSAWFDEDYIELLPGAVLS